MLRIIKGEDKEILIQFQTEETKIYKLNSITEIKAIFIGDAGKIEKTMTGGHIAIVNAEPQNGEISVLLSDTDTNLLKVGPKMSFEVELTEGTKTTIIQFTGELEVLKRI